MKTVKEVSGLTGVSIRTLRYYDEIGLLKPAKLSDAGYRLYDNKAIERLQQIMFFSELELPLADIKMILENPDYNREQVLSAQKALLENKRNHLNGIIELITDVMKGVNTMSFEAFNQDDIQKMLDHMLKCMPKETFEEQVKKYGSEEKYREYLAAGYKNEKAVTEVIKWYGSKEKAVEAVLQATGNKEEFTPHQVENEKIYRQLVQAKETGNTVLEKEAIAKLAEVYKAMFHLDNARAILLDLAKEYQQGDKLAQAIDSIYGNESAEYIAQAIQNYYGE